jgi:hypothetical protein
MFWLVGPRASVLWVFLGGRFYVGRSWSQRSSWLLLLVLDILEAAFCLPHLTIWAGCTSRIRSAESGEHCSSFCFLVQKIIQKLID